MVDLLERVPVSGFNLGTWDCGTTACAVGWACKDRWFNRQGLRMVDYRPMYRDAFSWKAVTDFFELSEGTAVRWFAPQSYDRGVPPSVVAARIRDDLKREVCS